MEIKELRSPWLVAVWPGMGGVAQIAGGYLAEQLGAQRFDELRGEGFFDVRAIEVTRGLMKPLRLPRGRFFVWRDPDGRRDLVIFLGDQQPDARGYAYCEALIDRAAAFGITRVLTFAAMASNVHPQTEPGVRVAATSPDLLAALRERGAETFADGEIAGLNGVLLAAAAARGIEAACLLGEMPFFATQLPNPKASRAILRLFAGIAGIPLELATIDAHVEAVESQLVRQLEQLQRASKAVAEGAAELLGAVQAESGEEDGAGDDDGSLSIDVSARIEELFELAAIDRARTTELKELLDEHGVFARYEDRFLDLFRKEA